MTKTVKKCPGPPFGVKVERFLGLGYHPTLEYRPGTYKYPQIFPGRYETNKPKRIVSKIPRWRRLLEVEEFSQRLSYRGEDLLKQRQWLKSVNGPGWQDLPSQAPERAKTFPKAERFPVCGRKSVAVPGPGTYGKGHIPHARTEEKSRSRGFSHSTLPPFERSSCGRSGLDVHRSYHLPPNLYHVKTSIDELVSKKVSKKGPYQLFSGNRFPDVIAARMSLLISRTHPNDPKHHKNAFKGQFRRCGKDSRVTSRLVLKDVSLSYKDPLDPGPNYYDPHPPPVVTPVKFPFNSSVKNARPAPRTSLQPPPGRYNPESKKRIKGDGLRSAFLSKTKRDLPRTHSYSWFE